MNEQRLWMLTDRAIRILNGVDENDAEATARQVDMAVDDLIEVRAELAIVATQEDQQAASINKRE